MCFFATNDEYLPSSSTFWNLYAIFKRKIGFLFLSTKAVMTNNTIRQDTKTDMYAILLSVESTRRFMWGFEMAIFNTYSFKKIIPTINFCYVFYTIVPTLSCINWWKYMLTVKFIVFALTTPRCLCSKLHQLGLRHKFFSRFLS